MADVADIAAVLPPDDVQFLREKYPNHIVRQVGAELHVLLRDFPIPPAYAPRTSDLLLRLPPGYPNAAPDMFWTKPDVKLASGAWPDRSEYHEVPGAGPGSEVYANVHWQRWSRHFQSGWIVGQPGLQSFVRTIQQELKRGV